MPKPKQPTEKQQTTTFVLGGKSFAKVSAVEGIRLNPAMKKRAAAASDEKISAEHRRDMIIRAHRKA